MALASSTGGPLILNETELSDYDGPPVSLEVLELEGRRAQSKTPQTVARQLLVAKKRAFEIARLLRARLTVRRNWANLANPSQIATLLLSEEMNQAISTSLFAVKSNKVGTSILEITTCGAIDPYSRLLGGKLVALLLLSPEVADDYRKRYGDRASIISSQLKNEERKKDCTLAWLNTTSLYSMGSSQYERLRLPAGAISEDQPETSFQHIGRTLGSRPPSPANLPMSRSASERIRISRGVHSNAGGKGAGTKAECEPGEIILPGMLRALVMVFTQKIAGIAIFDVRHNRK